MADGAGRDRSGLGPGKRKDEGARSPRQLLARTPASPAHAVAEGGEDGGSKAARVARTERERGSGLAFISGEEAVWEGEPT
jgi:hypothetical protein